MERFKIIEISGWEGALTGMRYPKNSEKMCDSDFGKLNIGEKDMRLCSALNVAGAEHRKFMRMIHVQMSIIFPRYVWQEFDTYHHNTKNSRSTMHKLFNKEKGFDLSDFEPSDDKKVIETLNVAIKQLNELREEYLQAPTDEILHKAKIILPESYLQERMVDTSYEELKTIYWQRFNHRLPEWREFCEQLIEKLPYGKEFILNKREEPVVKVYQVLFLDNWSNLYEVGWYKSLDDAIDDLNDMIETYDDKHKLKKGDVKEYPGTFNPCFDMDMLDVFEDLDEYSDLSTCMIRGFVQYLPESVVSKLIEKEE